MCIYMYIYTHMCTLYMLYIYATERERERETYGPSFVYCMNNISCLFVFMSMYLSFMLCLGVSCMCIVYV